MGDEVIQTGYKVEKSTSDGCTFEVIFENLKDIESVKAGSVITVEYTSVLNENAAFGGLGGGNTNTVHLEFSNNPNDEGTGNTPEDTVTVFTFKLDVDKVDGDNTAARLLRRIVLAAVPHSQRLVELLPPEPRHRGLWNSGCAQRMTTQ